MAQVDGGPSSHPGPKRQKQMTIIACKGCQRRKSKCDGGRPSCERCSRLKEECKYDFDSTVSRQDGLKRRLQTVTEKSNSLEALVSSLRSASDGETADILRLLKDGADVSDIVEQMAKPSSSNDTNLPTRRKRLNAADRENSYPTPPGDVISEDPSALLPRQSIESNQYSVYSEPFSRPYSMPDETDESCASPSSSKTASTMRLKNNRKKMRGYVEAFGNLPFSSALIANGYSAQVQRHQMSNFHVPVHFLQPLWETDPSPLSRVVQDYRDMARQAYSNTRRVGVQTRTDVTAFFRDMTVERGTKVPTTSDWASEMNKSFDDIDIFVRLACLYFQTHLMLWMVNPTAETYARMPDMIKPTPCQMMVPHISPIDTVPLPGMREALVHNLRDWVAACAGSLSVNWPHGLDASLEADPLTGRLYLTRTFEEHASKLENWSVEMTFLEIFPELRDQVMVLERNSRSESPPENTLGVDISMREPDPQSLRATVAQGVQTYKKNRPRKPGDV
ncbi:hypothetical protein IWX90DRAFT_172581 [Phyllosticta citrichinensis]|uniref:Zn(2)-C6 fungal-type domain-containing protein n=1 Tax=Phyllosticta citrichinensis TaxID=1130410 RepID=A0ABR1XVE9_9PEZI